MTEDQLWNDAIKMQERRNSARQKLDEVAEWAVWDISRGESLLMYHTLLKQIAHSTEDEIETLTEAMQSRIDMLMLKKLEKNL